MPEQGSQTYPALPQQQPTAQPVGLTASTIHEALNGATKIAGLTPSQAVVLAFVFFAVTNVAALGYLMWMGPKIINENNAILTRAYQEERERDRIAAVERDDKYIKAVQAEFERNRQANGDVTKILIGSVQRLATDMGKLEAQVTQLNSSMTDLKEVISQLNKKLGTMTIRAIAPMPRKVNDS